MSNPLVTIITPVYNHEKYLDEYCNSIISQTYQNIELIIIDDGSLDQSKNVIEKWLQELEKRFVNVIYIPRIQNKGLITNCNEGISLSEGKYVTMFASDDVMLPTNIEEKVIFLEQNQDYAMVYSDAYSGVDLNNHSNKVSKYETHYSGEIFKDLIDSGNFITAPTVILRKKVIEELGGYSTAYTFEDYPMWLEIAYRYKIGYIEKPLVYYRLSPNSLSRGPENYKIMIDSQECLFYDIQRKYNVNTESVLQRSYKNASVFFLKYDRTHYKYYRDKINPRDWEVFILDILYILRVIPKRNRFVNIFGKFMSQFTPSNSYLK